MKKSGWKASLFAGVAALSLPTYAQNAQDADMPTLHVNKGDIMTSTGGEFVTSSTGTQLTKNERLMVTKDSSATVVYKNHCERTYDEPGVYTLEDECRAGMLQGGARTAALIVGGVIVAGLIVDNINNNDNNNNQPISR